jgi:hypothetical protein
MRKIFLALTITLVLSLATGGALVFAAGSVALAGSLYASEHGLRAIPLNLTRYGSGAQEALVSQDGRPLLQDPLPGSEIDADDANDGAYCRGDMDKNHPAGEKLASEFFEAGYFDEDATVAGIYDEIMDRFCNGHYGFGEIALGYRIAAAAGVLADEVFELRAGGMGWGEILQEYGLEKPPKPPKPAKPPKLGNGNGQGNAYGHEKENGNNGQGNAYGKDKNKDKKAKKP